MDKIYSRTKAPMIALVLSLTGCMATAPTTDDGERISLDRVQPDDHSLTCSEISRHISNLDRLLTDYNSNPTGTAAKAVATEVGSQVASDVAIRSAYQLAPGGAQYIAQVVALGRQYLSQSELTDQQVASKASVRKNYLVSLYHQKSCGRIGTPTGDTQVRDAQIYLNKLGYKCGSADGIMGQKTRLAVENFQKDRGLPVNGLVTAGLIKDLKETESSVKD